MLIRNPTSGSNRALTFAENLTDHGQRSTAHLIEPQTFFSQVSGEKADNLIEKNLRVQPIFYP
jgi:hypothetical protein